jgi:hypothetical protein
MEKQVKKLQIWQEASASGFFSSFLRFAFFSQGHKSNKKNSLIIIIYHHIYWLLMAYTTWETWESRYLLQITHILLDESIVQVQMEVGLLNTKQQDKLTKV